MKLILKNEFHNTTTTINAKGTSDDLYLDISTSQAKKIEQDLCGNHDCSCGTVRGQQQFDLVALPDNQFQIVNKKILRKLC